MPEGLYVERGGHRTWLKWHRGRRRGSDPVFTGRRILEGMALGASVEVDLVVHGDGGMAVLHDLELDRETTGTGPVREADAVTLRGLNLRDEDGSILEDRVMLLEDLCVLLTSGTVHPEALLQLDYKEDETVLDDRVITNFARATTSVARNMIVSSGSAKAVDILTDAVPGMRSGYDPSDEERFRSALATGKLQRFVDDALAASPDAALIYLYWEIVTRSADAGFDIVESFHEHGKRIDAWTIPSVDDASLAVVERLLALRVDQITTDDPEGLAAALA